MKWTLKKVPALSKPHKITYTFYLTQILLQNFYILTLNSLLGVNTWAGQFFFNKSFLFSRYWKIKLKNGIAMSFDPQKLNYTNSLSRDFKMYNTAQLTSRHLLTDSSYQIKLFKPKFDRRSYLFNLFIVFSKLNIATGPTIFQPHASFHNFFVRNNRGGALITDVSRLFTHWKNMYNLFFNLIYYRICFLTFGTVFFRDEVLALNWQNSLKLSRIWRFTYTYFYLYSTKITNHGDYLFSRIRLTGLNLAFILDVPYHLKTLYYLHRQGFYSIGPVPINYSSALVDFAVPIGVNSVFTHLFFTRFILQIQRTVVSEEFNSAVVVWNSVIF